MSKGVKSLERQTVAIITIVGRENIGNRLQNYAVSEILTEEGFETSTLLYYSSDSGGSKERIKSMIYYFLKSLGVVNSKFFMERVKKNHKLSLVNEFDRRYIKITNNIYSEVKI